MKDTIETKELNHTDSVNRYKYRSFNDRIKGINIDVAHRIGEVQEVPEDADSFFKQSLDSWRELNLTVHFTEFSKEIDPFVQSLPLILYHKDTIVNILIKHIKVEESMAYEPILNLITMLARDLGVDFNPFFEPIIQSILPLIRLHDSKILEWTFQTVAYLFKYLSKQLLQNLIPIYNVLSPLLGQSTRIAKPYIRLFAAEAFSYLLRKAKSDVLSNVMDAIFNSLAENETDEFVEGIALLMFETMKSVNHTLHSRFRVLIEELFRCLHDRCCANSEPESSPVFKVFLRTLILICHHTKRETIKPLWELLFALWDSYYSELESGDNSMEEQQFQIHTVKMGLLLSLMTVCMSVRKGSRVSDFKTLWVRLTKFSSFRRELPLIQILPDYCLYSFLQFSSTLLYLSPYFDILTYGIVFLDQIYGQITKDELVLGFTLSLKNMRWEYFASVCLRYAIKYIDERWQNGNRDVLLLGLDAVLSGDDLTEALRNQTPSNLITKDGLIRFPGRVSSVTKAKKTEIRLIDSLSMYLAESLKVDVVSWSSEDLWSLKAEPNSSSSSLPCVAKLYIVLSVLPRIQIPSSSVFQLLQQNLVLWIDCYKKLYQSEEITDAVYALQLLIGQAIIALTAITLHSNDGLTLLDGLWDIVVGQLLELNNESHWLLKSIYQYLEALKSRTTLKNRFDSSALAHLFRHLAANVSSTCHEVRLYSLQILSLFHQISLQGSDSEECQIIPLALSVESTANTVATVRDKLMHLNNLDLYISSHDRSSIPVTYHEIMPRLILALLSENFRPLWDPAIRIFSRLSLHYPDVIWEVVYKELCRFQNGAKLEVRGPCPSWMNDNVLDLAPTDFKDSEEAKMKQKKQTSLSFTCHSWSRLSGIIDYNLKLLSFKTVNVACTQIMHTVNGPKERLDVWNYYGLILKALSEAGHFAETKSKVIVPMFIRFLRTEYEPLFEKVLSVSESEDTDRSGIKQHPASGKIIRRKLVGFLQLFVKFSHPQQIYKADILRSVYLHFLAKGDPELQQLALDCILAWKLPHLVPYESNLRNLVSEEHFREEISMITLDVQDMFYGDQSQGTSFDKKNRAMVMPLILRILYGKMLVRKTRSANRGMKARRATILAFLAGCDLGEMKMFIDLMLDPFKDFLQSLSSSVSEDRIFKFQSIDIEQFVSTKKQLGFLAVLEDVIKQLGRHLSPFMETVLPAILYIIHSSNRAVTGQSQDDSQGDDTDVILNDDEDMEKILDDTVPGETVRFLTAQHKTIRNLGIKRLVALFKSDLNFNFTPYVSAMFLSFLSPRIPKLPVESIQAPSPILELFATWAKNRNYLTYLSDFDSDLLPRVFDCLNASNVKGSVVNVVLGIIEDIVQFIPENSDDMEVDDSSALVAENILRPHVQGLLNSLSKFLEQSVLSRSNTFERANFTVRQINILAKIASFVTESADAERLVDILLPSLKKPASIVNEKMKENILKVFLHFVHFITGLKTKPIAQTTYYRHISYLFSTLRSRQCRNLLQQIFVEFGNIDPSVAMTSSLVQNLNSYSQSRLDEPDYDRRLDTFRKINDSLYVELRLELWLPILYNFIYFIQDPEELSIRSSASFGMIKFIDIAAKSEAVGDLQFQGYIRHIVFPAVKKGLKARNEQVRQEFVNVLSHLIRAFPSQEPFIEMVPLLADSDEEANFFNNIIHIQTHRRIRSLKRLSDFITQRASDNPIRSSLLTQIFIPLLSHYIFEPPQHVLQTTQSQGFKTAYSSQNQSQNHNLVNEVINTLGIISKNLPWNQYYILLRRFLKAAASKPEWEKIGIRVIIKIIENFSFDLSSASGVVNCAEITDNERSSSMDALNNCATEETTSQSDGISVEKVELPVETLDDIDELEETEETEETGPTIHRSNRIESQRIHDTLVQKLLPELHRFVTKKDDESTSVRVPVALAITKLLKFLPKKSLDDQLPRLLIKLCQNLKSRLQDARDSTRDTLVKILMILGPDYFQFIVRELQTSLIWGYQLHVLGFTIHSLLSNLVPTIKTGEIDYCLDDVVRILVRDTFGLVGQDKDNEEYVKKMKETKAARGLESWELVSKVVTLKSIGALLMPIKSVLTETADSNTAKKVDDTLNRISIGLHSNSDIDLQELLIFIHGLVTENLSLSRSGKKEKHNPSKLEKTYMVYVSSKAETDHFAVQAHKFVDFGLMLLESALKKEKFDVKNETHLSMLDPFVDILGDALDSKYTSILLRSIKSLSILSRMPLSQLNTALPVIVHRLYRIIGKSGNTKAEIVQASFKLLTIIIRDCKSIELSDKQLITVVNLIRPDLEEPERLGTSFSIIKAILSRRFVTEEVYDLMKRISEIMVTSQSTNVQERSRHCFLQFLLDYPLGKKRLQNHITYLVKNLSYQYESGRVSVMEFLHAVIQKFPQEIILEYAEILFLALTTALVNDESARCREMAGSLVKVLVLRMDESMLNSIFKILDKWMERSVRPDALELDPRELTLKRISAQAYGLIIDAAPEIVRPQASKLLMDLDRILRDTVDNMNQETEPADDDFMEVESSDVNWEPGYYALNTILKILKHFPTIMHNSASDAIWSNVQILLLHPHAWIRLLTSRLFGVYFNNIEPSTMAIAESVDCDRHKVTWLANSGELRKLAGRFCQQLSSKFLSADLGGQVVKNLFFLGKCLYYRKNDSSNMEDGAQSSEAERDEEEERGNSDMSNRNLFWLFRKLSFMARFDGSRNQGTSKFYARGRS
ncbi:armadillo-type protein [Paraphysoderma sedebokerense]|nr:armadillo-type protein [Paraphysoderma sedebokerense]